MMGDMTSHKKRLNKKIKKSKRFTEIKMCKIKSGDFTKTTHKRFRHYLRKRLFCRIQAELNNKILLSKSMSSLPEEIPQYIYW